MINENKNNNIKKNNEYTVVIDSLDNRGYGVARINHMVVFIDGALPGETVSIRIIKCAKNYCVGRIVKVIETSLFRVHPQCENYPKCGGCDLQHLRYDAQLTMKEEQVKDAFAHIAGLKDVRVNSIIPSTHVLRYRNKGSFPVSSDGKVGFYRKRSHDIIPCDDCLTQTITTMNVCRVFESYIRQYDITVYDEKSGKGLLRHLMTRTNDKDEIQVTIVSTERELPHERELIRMLLQEVPSIDGIIVNVNKRSDNVILGNEFVTIWGNSKLNESIGGRAFKVSPASFFQINLFQTERLYDVVKKFIKKANSRNVIDLYCGTGTIGLYISDSCERVKGIDIVKEAIEDAKENAIQNHINNASFECGKAEYLIKGIEDLSSFDTVILDPPRSGCDLSLVRTLCESNISTIIYVSCYPSTLARDCAVFTSNGFILEETQPVDMFPMSNHVETVVLMTKK